MAQVSVLREDTFRPPTVNGASTGLRHPIRPLGRAHTAVGQRQLDVLLHRQVADQVEALEDAPDLAVASTGSVGLPEALSSSGSG